MDQLRGAFANIQTQIGRMGPTQKLLMASLAVIAAMTLFLVSQYASRPALVDLMADSSDVQLVQSLRAAGIDATVAEGRVMVPRGQQHRAVATLGQAGTLPGDTTLLFNNLVQSQDWKSSREQHRQQKVIALQNELSRVIAEFRGISRATVIIDAPEAMGLGRAVRPPSASVTVFTRGNASMPQDTVDAVASTVAGANAGLTTDSVRVIEGSTGRVRSVSNEESRAASRYLEHAASVEKQTQQKIERLLAHVPGVIVTVAATVDVTQQASTQLTHSPENKGSVALATSLQEQSESTTAATSAAEPGVRSNQTADINSGGSSGQEHTKDDNRTEFQVAIGSTTTDIVDPRGMPTSLSASIVVPQAYIEELVRATRPAGDAAGEEGSDAVTPEEARTYFDDYKLMIAGLIEPLLPVMASDGSVTLGQVTVDMMPGGAITGAGGFAAPGVVGVAGGGGGGGGIASMLGGGLIETGVIVVLALISIVMMLSMVKRSTNRGEMPTAEQLVGVPPALAVSADLVGEADEGEAAMAGIEITDDEMNIKKMREQVGELIQTNPESAATLIGRWLGDDE